MKSKPLPFSLINVRETSYEEYEQIFFVVFATLIGALVRWSFVAKGSFPINDGGLFYAMVRDLQKNNFQLPVYTSYNWVNIPFAYAPFSFYLTGWIQEIFRVDLLFLFRFLPFSISALTVPAFYLLAKEIMGKVRAGYAVLAFGVLVSGFEWLIMGGGLTRATGTLFSILTLFFACQFFKGRSRLNQIFAILFAGMTICSHLEIGYVTIFSLVLLGYFLSDRSLLLVDLFQIGFGVLVISSPYWLSIILIHGFHPFIAAFQAGEFEWFQIASKLLTNKFTGEMFYTPFAFISLLSVFLLITRKEYLLPAWVVLILVANPRSVDRSSAVPIAMLVGVGLEWIANKGFNSDFADSAQSAVKRKRVKAGFQQMSLISFIFVFLLLGQSWIANYVYHFSGETVLTPLTERSIEAMKWVSKNTPKNSRFVLLTFVENWQSDQLSEWFPVIANRPSLGTVQGFEWLANQAFEDQIKRYEELNACVDSLACLSKWEKSGSQEFTHVFISLRTVRAACKAPCNLPIVDEIIHSPDFLKVYEDEDVLIFSKP